MTTPYNKVYLVLELRLRGGELRVGGGRDGEHGDGIFVTTTTTMRAEGVQKNGELSSKGGDLFLGRFCLGYHNREKRGALMCGKIAQKKKVGLFTSQDVVRARLAQFG